MAAADEGWEAAATRLEGLSINGGAQGADGALQEEGPEPPAQPGPAAAAPAAAEAGAPCHVDHALRDALAHPRNRASVLRLEAEVEAFVLKSEEPQHVFSGDMSSYERLLAHRTAQHWGLETSTVNHGPDQGRILAIRTPGTRQPAIKLADVPVAVQEGPTGGAAVPGEAGVGSPPAPRVLVRKRSDRMPSHRGGMMGPGMEGAYGMPPGANGQYRSVQEREAEYHRARARIFGEGAGGPGGFPGMGPGGAVPPPPPGGRSGGPAGPLNGGMGGGPAGSMGGMAGMATPFGGMMGPMGPQQMGAAMGYASRPGMPAGMAMPYGAPPGGPAGAYGASPGGFYGGPGGGYGGGGSGPRPTKAQLRNKEADLADPDFRRGRGLHAPRFDPGFGEEQASASMYVRPSYGSEFPELASSGGSSGGEGRSGGGRGRGGRADHPPASSPRSNGGGMGMGQPGASQMPSGPAAAAMYAAGYGGQMDPQQMMAMQAAYAGYGQAGMMPGAAMMAPMPGMVYPGAAAGGMPYGMMMQPYGYVPMRPGQQEAMMQAYAAGMQMAYAPYGSPGAAGMAMPVSPVSGMQNPLSPTGGGGPLGRRPSGSGRYSGGRGGGTGQRSAAATPRADSMSQDRQQTTPAAAAAAAVAAAQAAQQPAAQQQASQQQQQAPQAPSQSQAAAQQQQQEQQPSGAP